MRNIFEVKGSKFDRFKEFIVYNFFVNTIRKKIILEGTPTLWILEATLTASPNTSPWSKMISPDRSPIRILYLEFF